MSDAFKDQETVRRQQQGTPRAQEERAHEETFEVASKAMGPGHKRDHTVYTTTSLV